MKNLKLSKFSIFIISILVVIFNITLIFYPAEVIKASKDGLSLWFNNVLPSLLPFMVGINILISLGSINVITKLLEPIMKPIFRVSGAGAFSLVAGICCGYPMGAKIVSNLRENGEISKTEAQRLIGFTNNSGIIFILGTIGIGIFNSKTAGLFLISVHYLSALITGLVLRNYKHDEKFSYIPREKPRNIQRLSFSSIFSTNVINSMETLVQIGGFIILFSVLVKVFELIDISSFVVHVLNPISKHFKINENTVNSLIYGSLEITNGIRKASTQGLSKQSLIAAACILSFGGFSIHAQSINFISKTDIKIGFYIISKLIHATIALVLGLVIYSLFNFNDATTIFYSYEENMRQTFYHSFKMFSISMLFMLITVFFILRLKRIRFKR